MAHGVHGLIAGGLRTMSGAVCQDWCTGIAACLQVRSGLRQLKIPPGPVFCESTKDSENSIHSDSLFFPFFLI